VRDGVRIERFDGPRAEVRWLFQIAEVSAENLDGYIDDGDVLVAVLDERPVGVLQITETGVIDEVEINVLAVGDELQRQGIGRALVEACFTDARRRGCTRVLVSTGVADLGNLRFYQRCGFRMLRIERDAFTPETGYPDPIMVDRVRLWDRVWFDFDLTHPPVTLS
jgi:GNAT superfamily N-acetyltransferase